MLGQTCVAIVALLSLGHAKPTTKVLQHDDVIVAGSDGSVVVMKDFEYELKEARETLQRRKVDTVHVTPQKESHSNQRRCDESTEYQVLSVSMHLDIIDASGTARAGRQMYSGRQVAESCLFYNSLCSSTAPADRIYHRTQTSTTGMRQCRQLSVTLARLEHRSL